MTESKACEKERDRRGLGSMFDDAVIDSRIGNDLERRLIREAACLTKKIWRKSSDNISLKEAFDELEKKIIVEALYVTKGNQKKAARILGVKQTSFSAKMK